MDSMGSLHGSLPLSNRRQNTVLAPFKQTAFALTTLFKTASAEIDRAYSDGAREALELLLSSMDRENLGLQEGEGWRVRQMVMELYQGLGGEGQKPASQGQKQEEDVPSDESLSESETSHAEDSMSTDEQTASAAQDDTPTEAEETITPQAPISRFSVPSTDFTFQTSDHVRRIFGSILESESQDSLERRRPLSSISNISTKPTAKQKPSAPLGSGAGTKRRFSPNRDTPEMSPSKSLGRDNAKRPRHGDTDQ
jgi:hypothetical protein